MTTFKEFLHQLENLWGNIPGNPAFGGKKPSDGNGTNPYNINRPEGGSSPVATTGVPTGVPKMKKYMKKA